MPLKLGVLGGTFDPIHLGHLLIAEEVREHLGLDLVLFIPTGQPYLRPGSPVASAPHRLEMTRLGTADNPAFDVSAMEVERPGPTYTLDTLEALTRERGRRTGAVLRAGSGLGEDAAALARAGAGAGPVHSGGGRPARRR